MLLENGTATGCSATDSVETTSFPRQTEPLEPLDFMDDDELVHRY